MVGRGTQRLMNGRARSPQLCPVWLNWFHRTAAIQLPRTTSSREPFGFFCADKSNLSPAGGLPPVQEGLGKCQQAVPRGLETGDTPCCQSKPFLLLIITPHSAELPFCYLIIRLVIPILQRKNKTKQKPRAKTVLIPQIIQHWIIGPQMCVMPGRFIEQGGKK